MLGVELVEMEQEARPLTVQLAVGLSGFGKHVFFSVRSRPRRDLRQTEFARLHVCTTLNFAAKLVSPCVRGDFPDSQGSRALYFSLSATASARRGPRLQ